MNSDQVVRFQVKTPGKNSVFFERNPPRSESNNHRRLTNVTFVPGSKQTIMTSSSRDRYGIPGIQRPNMREGTPWSKDGCVEYHSKVSWKEDSKEGERKTKKGGDEVDRKRTPGMPPPPQHGKEREAGGNVFNYHLINHS
ncbi:hypothetical protein RUM44_002886 [Polyplax serrata]|uniref:Uncharacterized protein n=1 Tax=Polyplax serrata TaxID=468196 RepID=A0ABR1AX25_POLSC